MRIEGIRFAVNTASVQDIEKHFQACPDVLKNLAERVVIKDYVLKLRTHSNTFEAWDKQGNLAGLIACYANNPEIGDAFISNVSILPHERKRGIAKVLFQSLLESELLYDYRTISLKVCETNIIAVRLYQNYGFEAIANEGGAIHMQKKIRKAIGGYFGFDFLNGGAFPHSEGILVNSARNALEILLKTLHPDKVYIPYYTCSSVLEPFVRLGINVCFYKVNYSLELAEDITLNKSELIIVNNYFGIKDQYVEQLKSKYGNQLIIDNAQALFANADSRCHYIYSPRKFVGSPDGGILISGAPIKLDIINRDSSYDRCTHLLKRVELNPEEGYPDFVKNEQSFSGLEPLRMSPLTEMILHNQDYERVVSRRNSNFMTLHNSLKNNNRLHIQIGSFNCPMIYPFLASEGLKKHLIDRRVFVPTYWPELASSAPSCIVEDDLCHNLVCVPCDQRYTDNDMEYIIQLIHEY